MSETAASTAGRTLRLRRPRAAAAPQASRDATGRSLLTLPTLGLWFGVATGLMEVAARGLANLIDPRILPELLRTNVHWVWMTPASDLLLFGGLGLLLGLVAPLHPRRVERIAIYLFCGLAALTLLYAVQGLYKLAYVALACGIGARTASYLVRRREAFLRFVHRSLPALAALALVGGSLAYRRVATAEARALAALPSAGPKASNLLLIVLDTVRADSLSLYGSARDTTPELTRLATRGVRFDQARSTAPWTLPSHASMFTGCWPHELSVGTNRALDARRPTLAEYLAARGYATAGFVGNTHFGGAPFGLGRGFAHWEDFPENRVISFWEILRSSALGRRLVEAASARGLPGPPQESLRKHATQINDDLLRWLGEPGRGDRPFFAFANFIDAHDPYLLPPGEHRHFGVRPETAADRKLLATWFESSKQAYTPRDIALAHDAYDDCLAYLDGQLGRLFGELDRRGLLDNTLIVITSDHGEMWGEHQIYGHGRSLYRPEVHVPLLIFGTARVPRGAIVRQPASLRDLPASVVDLLAPGAPSPFPGRSLARYWAASDLPADPLLTRIAIRSEREGQRVPTPAPQGPMASIVAGGRTYIRNADGREELYDLADSAEERNLVASPAARAALQPFREELGRLRIK